MIRIRLMSPKEQRDFVSICSEYKVDITFHKGRILVDAKSLMGIMSIDTRFDCYITIGTDDSEIIKELESRLSKYTYE